MSVLIPDDILQSAKMSEAELKLEIAMMYQQRKLSTGKARRFAPNEFNRVPTGTCPSRNLHQLRCRRFSSFLKTLRKLGDIIITNS